MTENESIEFSSSVRAHVRDLIEAWSENPESSEASMAELELYELLRTRIPDPNVGVLQLAGAMAPILLKTLDFDVAHAPVCLIVNDPQDTILEKVDQLSVLLANKDRDPKVVQSLASDVEPHAIIVPSTLYARLCKHGVDLWMHRIAVENVPEEKTTP